MAMLHFNSSTNTSYFGCQKYPDPYPNDIHQVITYNTEKTIYDSMDFDISEYLISEGGSEGRFLLQNSVVSEDENIKDQVDGSLCKIPLSCNIKSRREMKKIEKARDEFRFIFRTKSNIEIMDDGYHWRKYGKKIIKNSPNPRNYFKCSVENCSVKKRVEREKDDPNYVITTYHGVHNHA